MPSGESDRVTITFAQGSKMCFRLKQTNKRKKKNVQGWNLHTPSEKWLCLEFCYKWWWCDFHEGKKIGLKVKTFNWYHEDLINAHLLYVRIIYKCVSLAHYVPLPFIFYLNKNSVQEKILVLNTDCVEFSWWFWIYVQNSPSILLEYYWNKTLSFVTKNRIWN